VVWNFGNMLGTCRAHAVELVAELGLARVDGRVGGDRPAVKTKPI
jgi:hypothetical protein